MQQFDAINAYLREALAEQPEPPKPVCEMCVFHGNQGLQPKVRLEFRHCLNKRSVRYKQLTEATDSCEHWANNYDGQPQESSAAKEAREFLRSIEKGGRMMYGDVVEHFQALLDENKQAEKLQDLLAIIHRDGGHHTAKVGLEQSILDARTKYYQLCDRIAEQAKKIKELEGELSRVNTWNNEKLDKLNAMDEKLDRVKGQIKYWQQAYRDRGGEIIEKASKESKDD